VSQILSLDDNDLGGLIGAIIDLLPASNVEKPAVDIADGRRWHLQSR
jgi:hypothetical protein